MILEVNEHGTMVLKEVFTPIKLVTGDGETLIIMMRDSGFELIYRGKDYSKLYEFKEGEFIENKHK